MRALTTRLIPILVLLALLLNACAPVATPTAAQAEPTAVPPTDAPATTAPEPTTAPAAEPTTLILATTTSTADSGLLDFILPDFEQKYNAKVDVIAEGRGPVRGGRPRSAPRRCDV
ncbi:MAG: hypothetical protein MUC34_19715 [Anaerolineae bacterium]|nr:hypothetical protein [Anaerolineae bacterium]